MKKTTLSHLFFLLTFTISSMLNAQNCGTEHVPLPASLQEGLLFHLGQTSQSGTEDILDDELPLKIHIIRTDAGSGGLSQSDLEESINVLNQNFVTAEISFYQCGEVHYIDDSDAYSLLQPTYTNLVNQFNEPGLINIYYTNEIVLNNGNSLAGFANFPWSTNTPAIFMANPFAIESTIAHEMGHFLGLYHTHETANGAELVNGSNCSSTGDYFCDTPADPTLSGLVNTSCIYTGNAVDANGALYQPDPTNLMSYSRKNCRTNFSNQQISAMQYFSQFYYNDLFCNAGELEISLNAPIVVTPNPINCNEPFSVETNILNTGSLPFFGDITAAIFDSNNTFVGFVEILTENNGLSPGFTYQNGLVFNYSGDALSSGLYTIEIFVFPQNGTDWISVLSGNFENPILTEVTCGGSACEAPINLFSSNITETSCTINWQEVPSANNYTVEFRAVGDPWFPFADNPFAGNFIDVIGLTPCTEYEFRVQANCGNNTSDFTTSPSFFSAGCSNGDCNAYGIDSEFEWIDQVTIGSFSNNSGNDDGLGDYTNMTITLEKNNSYNLSLSPGFADELYTEYWRIWIDLNQDNDFEDNGEMVFDSGSPSSQTVNGSFTIPTTAALGNTRMRISMKWVDSTDPGLPTACLIFDYGEVEDYTVFIEDPCEIPTAPMLNLSGTSYLCTGETLPLSVMNLCNGCTVEWSNGQFGNPLTISSPGTYFAEVVNSCGTSSPSESITVIESGNATSPSISSSGSTIFCEGEAVLLTATNICSGCTINWFPNGETGNSISATQTNDYYAVAVNDCGESLSSNVISVTVNELPNIPTLTANGPTSFCAGGSVVLTATNICNGCSLTWTNLSGGNTSNTITTTGSYTVTATNDCGTSAPSTPVFVEVNDLPTMPLITANGPTSFCEGGSVTITATNVCDNCTVNWIPNIGSGNPITITEAGNYTASYSNSCGTGPSSQATTISTTSFVPEITINNQCYLAAPSGNEYQWFLDGAPIGEGQFFTAEATGYYTLTMTNSAGCTGSSEAVFIEGCLTTNNEVDQFSALRIFPNPATDDVHLSFSLDEAIALQIDLWSIDGRVLTSVFKGTLNAGSHKINTTISTLPNGVYLYRFVGESGVTTRRLVVRR